MKKIYIITTFTGTFLSSLIKNIIKTPYAHVSLALNEDLKPMYAFGRLNPKTPIFAGFVEENVNQGLYEIRSNTMCRVYSLEITQNQYDKLIENIKVVSDNRKSYDYDVKALMYLSINRPRKRENKYVCSNFVADMLEKSDIDLFTEPAYKVRPNDYYDKPQLELIYEGLLSKYPERKQEYLIPAMSM